MRDSGRISAAIAVLEDFDRRKVPLKTALADWARGARYAGAKDRAWISGLCLDALRRRRSLAATMEKDDARAVVLAALARMWRLDAAAIDAAGREEHGIGPLSDEERARLDGDPSTNLSVAVAADVPDFVAPLLERAFGADAAAEGRALAERAPVDLRMNTLKAAPEKILGALEAVGAEAHPYVATAARIAAPDSAARAPAVTVIPAFNKGWAEVQDLGSQIAAAAAGDVRGKQVLDLCAGGGGKTLALAALMGNTGQIYATDRDARRLKPLYERAERAGVRNLQIRNPAGGEGTDDLEGRMDVVFLDAPCTGAGTWRRHPDTKWRLTPQQLASRMAEQDAVLDAGGTFVKPGGALVYVTCSFFAEENDDRVDAFLGRRPDFARTDPAERIAASRLLTEAGLAAVALCRTPTGAVQLTPRRIGADAFFIATLRRHPAPASASTPPAASAKGRP